MKTTFENLTNHFQRHIFLRNGLLLLQHLISYNSMSTKENIFPENRLMLTKKKNNHVQFYPLKIKAKSQLSL